MLKHNGFLLVVVSVLALICHADDTKTDHLAKCQAKDYASCYNHGTEVYALNKIEEATKYWTIACDGKVPQGCFNLGTVADSNGEKSKAKSLYERACGAGLARGCSNLGAIADEAGNAESAELMFRKGCELGEPSGCYNLSIIQTRNNEATAAKQSLEKACAGKFTQACDDIAKFKKDDDYIVPQTAFAAEADTAKPQAADISSQSKGASHTNSEIKQKESKAAAECQCRQFLNFIESQINREKSIGKRTGFVDKKKLYNLGQTADRVERYINMRFGSKLPRVCPKKYPLDVISECNIKSAEMVYQESVGSEVRFDD